ncbi:putative tricarboxylic transport membrane protein [Cytobacillus oceanisediminis]|jgi:putative tricarboxylic transport membrane protein|uniref:Putative tricarboxylic transport membrane protein n=1 Tax=Cytobacillus oceanisediminis TaxID=665099 RepID=A0A2V2ZZ95_9BACI|nr:tripartite tricarboxylate transporter TctB family protein [Cytobacillus oceanisediminis]PWW29012.1 putative tricarboxylic transport membrane protein [Cytobacillus oceanisediminis]
MLKRINQKIAVILASLAGVYLILSYSLPKYQNAIIDADVVPKGLGFLLLFFAVLLFFDKKEETEAEKQKRTLSKSNFLILLAVLAFILIYISLLEILGFLIMTTLFIFGCSLFLGYKKHIANGIVSVVFSVAIYGLFNYLLRINLPAGIIPF